MLRLIEKDIRFNWKWALLLAAVAVVVPIVVRMDPGETRVILPVYVIGTVLANSHLVSRACYLEDGAQTRRFLASLPVTRTQLVLSKYALGLLCAGVSIGLTSLSAFALGLRPSARGVAIALICLLPYYAVFLGVYFRANYGSAEKAHAALSMLTVLSAVLVGRGGVPLDGMAMHPAVLPLGVGMGLLAFAASAGLSLRASGRFLNGRG